MVGSYKDCSCFRGTRRTLFIFLWLLCTVCRAEVTTEPENQVPGLHSGLLFQPLGPLVLATGKWTLVLRFQEEMVQKQATEIQGYFAQISTTLTGIQSNQSHLLASENKTSNESTEGERGRHFILDLVNMWERERAWMEYEMSEAKVDIDRLRGEIRLSRKTRGLIPFLGDGLKWLFGTATEKDTQKLHKQISQVQVNVGKLHHIIELQTTIIGTLTKNQKANQKNIQELAEKTNKLYRTMLFTREANRVTHTNIRRELDLSRSVSSAIRTAGAAVMVYRREVHQLTQAMAHTHRGRVTPTILPPRKLRDTLRSVRRRLPAGWAPALPSDVSPTDIYERLGVTAVPLVGGWEVHITLPLQYQPYSRFQLYHVTPIPTHFANSTSALVTEIDSDYFAISDDRRLHLELSSQDMKKCQRHRMGVMCREFTPLIHEERTGCLYDAFRGDTERTDSNCRRRIIRPRPQLYTMGEEKWLYVMPTEESFTLQCADQSEPQGMFTLHGTGVFALPAGCSAMGEHTIIPAHLMQSENRSQEIELQDLTHFRISLDVDAFLTRLPGEVQVNQTDLVKLIERMPDAESTNLTLDELRRRVHDWKPVDLDSVGGMDTLPGVHVTLTGLGMLVMIGIIAWLCCKCRRRQGEQAGAAVAYVPAPQHSEAAGKIEILQLRITRLEEQMEASKKKQEHLERFL